MIGRIKNGDVVKHFKGGLYKVLYADTHYSEDHSLRLVVYQSQETGEIWVRPYSMFTSKVDKVKYPDVQQEYRFEVITSENTEPELVWTKTKPTQPGFYWHRYKTMLEIGVVYLDKYSGDLCVHFAGDADSIDLDTMVLGEWAGPISKPGEFNGII